MQLRLLRVSHKNQSAYYYWLLLRKELASKRDYDYDYDYYLRVSAK